MLFISANIKGQKTPDNCKVSMTLYRADMKPLGNKLVSFRSDDGKHQEDVVTKSDGYCMLYLNKNTHYDIIYEDLIYSGFEKISNSDVINITGEMIIDGGLFSIVYVKVFDNMDDYGLLKGELITCESQSTGIIYEATTNMKGIAEFYVPRNSEYVFHSTYEKNLRTLTVGNGKGASIYSMSFDVSTTPASQYYKRLKDAEAARKAWLREWERQDSLIGTIAINVLVFINITNAKNASFHPSFREIKVYDSSKKNKLLGVIKGSWSIETLCEKDMRLCLASVTKEDGGYSQSVLHLKLTRGLHSFYIENEDGTFNQDVEVDIPVRKGYNYLLKHKDNYSITAPLCVTL